MELCQVGLLLGVTIVLLLTVSALPAVTSINETVTACDHYDYCEGENFPRRVKVADLAIHCEAKSNPTDHCCLPYAKHYVCYDITVEGDRLNFDADDFNVATDFASLCRAMVESLGKKGGRHNAATKATGGGRLAYNYGRWFDPPQGVEHLRHVACEYQEPDDN